MAEHVAKRSERQVPARRSQPMQSINPYRAMREMMNDMMEDFFGDWPMMRVRPFEWRMEAFTPYVDVVDEGSQLRVAAEVPGMSPEDLDLSLTDDSLILRGEKRSERDQEEQGVRHRERSFGSFERVIPLPAEVERDKVEASFRNGVLNVILPKSPQAMERSKKIQINVQGDQQQEQRQSTSSQGSSQAKAPEQQGSR